MNLKNLFQNRLIISVVIMSFLSLVALGYFVPQKIEKNIEESVTQNSKLLVDHIRIFRSYYTENILKKVKQHTNLKINFDHKVQPNTIPLPATMVHDIGELFTKGSDLEVKMYSDYPFPHRSDRVLDTFEKESLVYLLKNPDQIYVKKDFYHQKNVIRVAIPDFLYSDSCVQCHNSRIDSPKTDWKLGDIRGVIEVITPIDDQLASNNEVIWYVAFFVLINAIVLIIILIYVRQKELSEVNRKLEDSVFERTAELEFSNRRLGDYKRGIDAGAIISITDRHGIIKEVNDAFLTISGYKREELIGQPHNLIRHPDMPDSVFKEIWETIKSGVIWQGDIKNKKKNNESYYVHTTIVPIVNSENTIEEYLAIRYDITELIEVRDQALAAEKSKDDFLSSMSHELRTPLNAIIGFSQILSTRSDIPPLSILMIEKIYISGKNLLRLVNTILDFSKLKSGKIDFSPRYIVVMELFKEVYSIIEPMADQKSIQIIQNFKDEEMLWGDYDMLKQCLLNFISNAIKFSLPQTTITMEYEVDNTNGFFRLSVCDQGEGMSEEGMKKLFLPFSQLQKNHAKSGTGLGLSIVKKMVEEYHNGKIKVNSKENLGSCFIILLPMHKAA
ncbi:MAG: ATP-binding protein [Sulfurimonas sp.]|jgi:PAS domain S-box-containing protein